MGSCLPRELCPTFLIMLSVDFANCCVTCMVFMHTGGGGLSRPPVEPGVHFGGAHCDPWHCLEPPPAPLFGGGGGLPAAVASYISHLTSSSGCKITLPRQIANKFRGFYSSLYNLPDTGSAQSRLEDYLVSSQMPQLSEDVREQLEAPISLLEMQQTLGTFKLGKAPGPGGFTLSYYSTFFHLLGPHLVSWFNALGSGMSSFPTNSLWARFPNPKGGQGIGCLWPLPGHLVAESGPQSVHQSSGHLACDPHGTLESS